MSLAPPTGKITDRTIFYRATFSPLGFRRRTSTTGPVARCDQALQRRVGEPSRGSALEKGHPLSTVVMFGVI